MKLYTPLRVQCMSFNWFHICLAPSCECFAQVLCQLQCDEKELMVVYLFAVVVHASSISSPSVWQETRWKITLSIICLCSVYVYTLYVLPQMTPLSYSPFPYNLLAESIVLWIVSVQDALICSCSYWTCQVIECVVYRMLLIVYGTVLCFYSYPYPSLCFVCSIY